MYPDLFNAKVRGERAWDVVGDEAWVADEYIPRVGKRGAEIIEARGASSAASAANAAVDHVHDWVNGTQGDDWVSMAVPSPGAYGVEEGIISSFPCRCSGGEWEIVEGLDVPEFSQERIDKTVAELVGERDAVRGARAWSSLRACQPRPGLGDLAVTGQLRHHPVQVVLLHPHRVGDLGDGDPGAVASRAARPARPACRSRAGGRGGRCRT